MKRTVLACLVLPAAFSAIAGTSTFKGCIWRDYPVIFKHETDKKIYDIVAADDVAAKMEQMFGFYDGILKQRISSIFISFHGTKLSKCPPDPFGIIPEGSSVNEGCIELGMNFTMDPLRLECLNLP